MNKRFHTMVLILCLSITTSGCATTSRIAESQTKNAYKLSRSGVIFGQVAVFTDISVKEMCDKIQNADPRCASQDKYIGAIVMSAFGFAAGPASMWTLIERGSDIERLAQFKGRFGDKDAPYAKAKGDQGQYGQILEIASAENEGKCYWSGLPRAGGTVCPAYNWDYRKDLRDWDSTSGFLTVKEK